MNSIADKDEKCTSMNFYKSGQEFYRWLLLAAATILLMISVYHLYGTLSQDSIQNDVAVFSQMTQTLLDSDKTLYIDFWDHKPPGIYFFTAPFVWMFGTTTFAIHAAAMVILTLFVTGITLLAKALFQQRSVAMATAVLALYYGLLIVYPRILETVFLMTTLATWSMYCAVVARGRTAYLVGSGFLFGAAVLAKQPIATNLITLFAFVWFFAPRTRRLFSVVMVVIGGMSITIAVIGWALWNGNFEEMWLYSTVANVRFSLSSDYSWLSETDGFYLKRDTLPTLLPLILMSAVSAVLLFQDHRKQVSLLLIWVIFAIPGAILGRGLTLNYFYQVVPPLIVLSAIALLPTIHWRVWSKLSLLILFVLGVIFLPQTYLANVTSFFIPTQQDSRVLHETVAYITATTDEQDCIFYWGDGNHISYYSGRYSCTAAPHAGVLMLEDAFDIDQNRIDFMEELLAHPPKYHILNTNWAYFPMLEQYVGRYVREQIPDVPVRLFRVDTSSWHDASVHFADLFNMIGYDIYRKQDEVCSGDRVSYSMTWRVQQAPTQYYQMFLQLREAETHTTIAGVDSSPLADYPTQTWTQAGEIVLSDIFTLTIPEDTPSGTYYVATGFYDTNTLERLNILDDSGTVQDSETTLDTFSIVSCTE